MLPITYIIIVLAVTSGVIVHVDGLPYESMITHLEDPSTGRVYLYGYVELSGCNNITRIYSIEINEFNITSLSLSSGAVIFTGCEIIINTRALGLHGLLDNRDNITIKLSYIDNNNREYSTLITIEYILYNVTDSRGGSISEYTIIADNGSGDVIAYYNYDTIPLDYKRFLTLFVLLALTIAALVREYGHR